MGLYPVNPDDGRYVIGSPLVEKAIIRLNPKYYSGGTFTVIAHGASNQNIYVQSASLNGQPLDRSWITHDEIVHGGTLELEMGVLPNKNWPAVSREAGIQPRAGLVTVPVFSLSSLKGGEGRGEEASTFSAQIPSPQPSPRLSGEREPEAVSGCGPQSVSSTKTLKL